MMAGYQAASPLQRTLELARGAHAYFYDRWWQQRAILLSFKSLSPGADRDASIGTTPTVNQTPGGVPAGQQLVDLGSPTPSYADAQAAPLGLRHLAAAACVLGAVRCARRNVPGAGS